MYALALTILFFGLLWWLFSLATDYWLIFIALWIAYYHVSYWLRQHLYSDACRNGALARWVHKVADVAFTEEARARLYTLDPDKVYIFACEPHAPQCLHMALGFAAHACKLPDQLAHKTYVAAEASAFYIPVVREVLAIYGVVDAARDSLESLLKKGHSFAIVPSGIPGKSHALLDKQRDDKSINIYRRREKFGFLSLAARYGAQIVPVLSPDEPHAYSMHFRHWRAWPFVLFIGRYFIFPNRPIRFHVGEPIDTKAFDARSQQSMSELAAVYYDALCKLAPDGVPVHVRYIDDSE